MRRLYVELEVPDNLSSDPVEVADLVLDDAVNIKRAQWHPIHPAAPRTLTRVGYLNPQSGVLHRAKLDLHPGVDWAPVYLYDPAQFAQVDGGEHCATLAEALRLATWKVTFKLHTGEQVRLVRYASSNVWAYRPFVDDLRDELVAMDVPDETLAVLTKAGLIDDQ